jgi:hypothetical protein
LGAKVTLLVSMLVSVGGVGSTGHAATQMTANAEEKVQMTMSINSEIKDQPKLASRTCNAATRVDLHRKKRVKAKKHPGFAKKNGWLRAALQRGQVGIALL